MVTSNKLSHQLTPVEAESKLLLDRHINANAKLDCSAVFDFEFSILTQETNDRRISVEAPSGSNHFGWIHVCLTLSKITTKRMLKGFRYDSVR